ncbi:MAG: hypothetical protein RLZZ272_1452 [Actinomycetota bacterium]
MHVTTVGDLARTVLEGLDRLPPDVDLVAGIPRSGMLPASLIALHLNVPLTDVGALLEGRVHETGTTRRTERSAPAARTPAHVLVVDDLAGSGGTMRDWRDRLDEVARTSRLTYLAVYADPAAVGSVDLHLARSAPDTVFEWNVLHLRGAKHVAVELEGVLAAPLGPDDHLDATTLRAALDRTRPRIVPSHRIGRIITARSDRHRPATEAWLERHGIQHDGLVMRPDDVEDVVGFKARALRDAPQALYIEPDPEVAAELARRTGRAVWCPSAGTSVPIGPRGARRRARVRARLHRRGRLVALLRALLGCRTHRSSGGLVE